MADPFARPIAIIDHELHEQVGRREAAITEILHGVFVVERASLVIDRLIEERLRATSKAPAKV